MQNKNMIGASLIGANLAGKDFVNCDLRRADLTGANLNNTQFSYASLAKANLEMTNLEGANLEGACLKSASLKKSSLINANLKGVYLMWADLRGANLSHANLEGAFLDNARLDGTILDNVDISGIRYNIWTTWPVGFIPSEILMTMLPKDVNNAKDLIFFLKQLSQTRAIDYEGTLPEYLKSLVLIIEDTKEEHVSPRYVAQLFNEALFHDSTKFEDEIWIDFYSTHKDSHDNDYQKAQYILIKQIKKLDGNDKSALLRCEQIVQNYLYGGIEAIEEKPNSYTFDWIDIIEFTQMADDDHNFP